jgi:hypothetical protein
LIPIKKKVHIGASSTKIPTYMYVHIKEAKDKETNRRAAGGAQSLFKTPLQAFAVAHDKMAAIDEYLKIDDEYLKSALELLLKRARSLYTEATDALVSGAALSFTMAEARDVVSDMRAKTRMSTLTLPL